MDLPEGILNDWVNSSEILHRSEMLGHARYPSPFLLESIPSFGYHLSLAFALASPEFSCLKKVLHCSLPRCWSSCGQSLDLKSWCKCGFRLDAFWVAPILLSQWDDISRWAIHFFISVPFNNGHSHFQPSKLRPYEPDAGEYPWRFFVLLCFEIDWAGPNDQSMLDGHSRRLSKLIRAIIVKQLIKSDFPNLFLLKRIIRGMLRD